MFGTGVLSSESFSDQKNTNPRR